jgi:hypothetical protein
VSQLAVLIEVSQLFLRVNCKRKALFYLTQVGVVCWLGPYFCCDVAKWNAASQACEMLSVLGWLAAQCGLQPSVAEALRGVTPGMLSVKGTERLQAVLEQQRRECVEKQWDEPMYDGMAPNRAHLRIKPRSQTSPPVHSSRTKVCGF